MQDPYSTIFVKTVVSSLFFSYRERVFRRFHIIQTRWCRTSYNNFVPGIPFSKDRIAGGRRFDSRRAQKKNLLCDRVQYCCIIYSLIRRLCALDYVMCTCFSTHFLCSEYVKVMCTLFFIQFLCSKFEWREKTVRIWVSPFN